MVLHRYSIEITMAFRLTEAIEGGGLFCSDRPMLMMMTHCAQGAMDFVLSLIDLVAVLLQLFIDWGVRSSFLFFSSESDFWSFSSCCCIWTRCDHIITHYYCYYIISFFGKIYNYLLLLVFLMNISNLAMKLNELITVEKGQSIEIGYKRLGWRLIVRLFPLVQRLEEHCGSSSVERLARGGQLKATVPARKSNK